MDNIIIRNDGWYAIQEDGSLVKLDESVKWRMIHDE